MGGWDCREVGTATWLTHARCCFNLTHITTKRWSHILSTQMGHFHLLPLIRTCAANKQAFLYFDCCLLSLNLEKKLWIVAHRSPPKKTVLLAVHAHINPEKAAAPPPAWRWGTQALRQMIHGPRPSELRFWLVVGSQWPRERSDEVLAHSHSSREGLQSHAAHSCLWLFFQHICRAHYSERLCQHCFGTNVLIWFVLCRFLSRGEEWWDTSTGGCPEKSAWHQSMQIFNDLLIKTIRAP